MIRWIASLLLITSAPVAAQEFITEPMPDHSQGQTWNMAESVEGSVGWDLLSTTREVEFENDEGWWIIPEYPEDIQALDDQTIKINGYMMPLQSAEKQTHFILMAYPPDCPFCLSAGPRFLVEVKAADPISFGYEAMLIEGRFDILDPRTDPDESGLFYRMSDARRIK